MKKADFKRILKRKIILFGYWSKQVEDFNNQTQKNICYHIWLKWHNETKAELKNTKQ